MKDVYAFKLKMHPTCICTILCKIQYYLHIRKHRKQIDGIKEYGKNKTFSVSIIYGISSQKVPLPLLHAYDIKKWYKQTDVRAFFCQFTRSLITCSD